MLQQRSLVLAGSLLVLVASAACGGGTTDPDPDPDPVLSSVSGGGQSANAGQAVANPLVVRVTQGGSAASGRAVTWAVTAGGGSVNPTSSSTDASGNASTVWTLGPNAGANTVQASGVGMTGSPVTFNATAIVVSPPPTTAAVSVLDNSFNPASARVAAGGTVTWTWGGAVDHNVTFATGTSSTDKTTGTFDRSFPTAGTFGYQCTIHGASMSGTIVVE